MQVIFNSIHFKNKFPVLFFSLFLFLIAFASNGSAQNTFNYSNLIVNKEDLREGGPKKDDIPAISNPQFIKSTQAHFLKDMDPVIGIEINHQAKAYPLKILNWHEIVNDTLDDKPIAITYCPLTKSAIVYNRIINETTELNFGVSGLLYICNLVMYDRNTHSLWPQLSQKAVSGNLSNTRLEVFPSIVVSWKEWKTQHPETLVLSLKTGYKRDYDFNPYEVYQESARTRYKLNNLDDRMGPKNLVIAIKLNNMAKVYPLYILRRHAPIEDTVGGVHIKVLYDSSYNGYIIDDEGKILPGVTLYWFAWSSFNKNSFIHSE